MSINQIIEEGDIEKIKLLDLSRAKKADLFYWAVRSEKPEVLEYLHSLGFDWSSEVFMYAMPDRNHNVEVLKYLHKNKFSKDRIFFAVKTWRYVDSGRLWYLETYPKNYSDLDKRIWDDLLIATISDGFRD